MLTDKIADLLALAVRKSIASDSAENSVARNAQSEMADRHTRAFWNAEDADHEHKPQSR